ncbi:MAG: signal peptidase I [Planctomycetes bacterium]|nr:signal peptidase I [Planctomycetota bacterium]
MNALASRTFWLKLFQRACVAYACVTVPFQCAFAPTRMVSNSMWPTLQGTASGGDMVLVSKLSCRLRPPRRGELVAFTDDEGVRVIKRVVGLPGEVVRIADGRMHVNGRPLTQPAVFRRIRYENHGSFSQPTSQFRVAEGCYFVLGDDSSDSYDSRFWGALSRSRIEGRAVAILWPWRRLRWLEAAS